MQLYGYEGQRLDIAQIESQTLAEITLVATPDELRKIAAFLSHAATEMERWRDEYSHLHLSDYDKAFRASPHVTVFDTRKAE